jgi:transketolase N-terminal domain/subunit
MRSTKTSGRTRHELFRSLYRHHPRRRFQPCHRINRARQDLEDLAQGADGKRYRATLSLGSVERLVDNAAIAQKFRALGFPSVRVTGSGATRRVEGMWPGKDTSANMPRQIVAVARLC